MRPMTCIEDLRQAARRRVPRAFFDYAEAGSYSQETLRANREDLARIKLRQRVLVDVSQRDLATTIMGEKVSLPLALAPIGLCGMQRGAGGRQAVLVPALCDEGPRLHPRADRARRRRKVQRAGAYGRSPGARPAPL